MMYCPICKSEFRDGFEFCSTCKCALVDESPEEKRKEPLEGVLNEEIVFLTNVRDEHEAGMIESILSSNCIQASWRHRDAGGYLNIYMGNSLVGIDIYVLESAYEAAKELIELEQEVSTEEVTIDYKEEQRLYEEEVILSNKRRKIKVWIMLFFFSSGFLFLIINFIKMLIDNIFN